jgi:hypothetical protein
MLAYGSANLSCSKLTFIAQHQRHSQKSVFAPTSTVDCRVDRFESVNEQKRQQNDVLSDLGSGKNRHNPFSEPARRKSLVFQSIYWRRW